MTVSPAPSIARAAALATAATIVGYATTLIQQLVYARALGVGAETDALAAALVWAVSTTGLVGSAFASIVIPPYTRAAASDPAAARRLFRTANGAALGFGVLMSAVTWTLAAPLAGALLPGAGSAGQLQLEHLLRLSAPLHLFWIAVLSAIALSNAHERYVLAAASTIVPSLPVIIVLSAPGASAERAAIAYSVGAIVQLVLLSAALRPWWLDYVPRPGAGAGAILRARGVPIVGAFLILNAAGLAARAIASLGGTGDVAVFDYASRLSVAAEQVALSGALAVTLTTWSADAVGSAPERLPIGPTLRLAVGLVVGAAAALALLGADLVAVLFEGGRFAAADTARVGELLAWIAPGMAARMLLMIAVRALLARGATWTLTVLAVLVLLTVGVVGLFAHAMSGVIGVAFAYSAGWAAAAIGALFLVEADRAARVALLREGVAAGVAASVASAATIGALAMVGREPLLRLGAGGVVFLVVGLGVGWLVGVSFVRVARSRLALVRMGMGS